MKITCEESYGNGKRQALINLLRDTIRELDLFDKSISDQYRWTIERTEAVQQLRHICMDNDWEDSDHLGDVIEKHLGKYL